MSGLRSFHEDLLRLVLARSPIVATIVDRWTQIGLPDCWLVAGCLAQTVWNDSFGLPATHGISDIDLVYFDGEDLSAETEAGHAARLRTLFADLGLWIDVKNEARVHLWYIEKFGNVLAPYVSTEDAITTFPTTATAVGVQPRADGLHVFAPYGLSDLLGLIVRPNKKQITQAIYDAKVKKWRARWPDLRVVGW
ncbi:MAG TPA: nucleotidyltransferase family protein [Reyranella sp.]|nr:nucleotidyltransferase family protein [Reyranella sp.]